MASVYPMMAILAAVAVGFLIYAIAVRSKAIGVVSALLVVVCALTAYVLWAASRMVFIA